MPDVKEITNLLKSTKGDDIKLIEKAYTFSKEAHKDQKRYSGEPYFVHLFNTAKILAELGQSSTTIAAGFLHDSIEDVHVLPETIEKEFGTEILFLVEGVTKLGHIKYHESNWHTESLRKLFVAMSEDIRVLIIKLADRLHNMRTLESVPEEKQHRIASETLEVYAPIAYRLGIGKIHRELEDLAFSYVHPKEYMEVQKIIERQEKARLFDLEKFHKDLNELLVKEKFKKFETSYRVKGLYSLWKKIQKFEIDPEQAVEKIYDVSALRIIVSDVAECYRALGVVHSKWRPLPGRIKDYIAFPKPNGYQSLHTTVFTGDGNIVEVQIRTFEMHQECEYGIVSHITYKTKGSKEKATPTFLWIKRLLPESISSHELGSMNSDVPTWIKDLVQYHKATNTKEFEESLRADFFQQRIFVFTPKGDVVDLPIDSTPIDFAYTVHSDVGNHMSGAKVNGKLISLDTVLKNGDIVEIQTKKSSKPSRKWIDAAKTTMAKRHIRQALQNL